MRFIIDLGQAPDGGWGGHVPDLPGVVVGGYATADEARESLRTAIEMHLEGMREDGVPFLEPSRLEILEVA